jgi:hypothetical protein
VAIKNRLVELAKPGATLNGIDFVEIVEAAPLDLRVHFINAVAVKEPGIAATIDGGDIVPQVKVSAIADADWSIDGDGRPLLTLHAHNAGDFSNYRLTLNRGALNSTTLDPFFDNVLFSFKVFCPSDFDCAPLPPDCPPDDTIPPPIDYLAKDFSSFRRALSDFSALRYPGWHERSEADFGVMFMEALSALADDLSYQQDRVAAEATLDTATERRSVVRHARLVDYTPRPATSARTQLVCTVSGTALPAGIEVSASDPAGGVVPFEIGTGLADTTSYRVDPKWNVIAPYWWDDSERCLRRGSTTMWIQGSGLGLYDQQPLLIDTKAASAADPPLRQIVHVEGTPVETTDPLFGPAAITRISFKAGEVLLRDHDLTQTTIRGNVVPATQARRRGEIFAIGNAPPNAPQMPLAFARLGANATVDDPAYDYRYALGDATLAWLGGDDPEAAPTPEIRLQQPAASLPWNFTPRLLDSAAQENVFALEPASYRRIANFADGTPQMEYDGDSGETILFGNGTFGALPQPGDVFDVVYRVGLGARGNVASDAVTAVNPAWLGLVSEVSNPFPASGGADRETNEQVRRRAPEAFQARQFRAVRAEDYETEAERLDWVQKAGTAFRWTGSWFTVFTAADPKGGDALPAANSIELIELLNRRRLAGYESYVPPPRYVSIDLVVNLCARPEAFSGDVERDVLERLAPARRDAGGFFVADRFTFGTPLERSRLEAAIQGVPGVAGVLSIRYRRRAFVPNFVDLPDEFTLAVDEILRIDNDSNHPERGSVAVHVYGGR